MIFHLVENLGKNNDLVPQSITFSQGQWKYHFFTQKDVKMLLWCPIYLSIYRTNLSISLSIYSLPGTVDTQRSDHSCLIQPQ